MKKKIVSIALTAALTCGLFSGCVTASKPPYSNLISATESGIVADGRTDVSEAIENLAGKCENEKLILWFGKGKYYIGSDTKIQKNVSVMVTEGAEFVIAENIYLKLGCDNFTAPDCQIFFGSGSVTNVSKNVEVNPAWFGAVPNDGKDDSEGLNKAISSCGGKLRLASGEYTVSAAINLDKASQATTSGLSVLGAKDGKTVINVRNGVSAFCNETKGSGANMYNFSGIAFKGDGSGNAIEAKARVYIANCNFYDLDNGFYSEDNANGSVIVNNYAENVKKDVFHIGSNSMFLYFSGNVARNSGTLVFLNGNGAVTTGIMINNCKTYDMTGIDINLTSYGGDTSYVDGCEFNGGTGECAVYINSCLYPHVSYNVIQNGQNGKNGIIIEGCSHCVDVSNNKVIGMADGITAKSNYAISINGNILSNNTSSDIKLIANDNMSVHENYCLSENGIAGIGLNSHTTVFENRFAKNGTDETVKNMFAQPDAVTVEGNIFGYDGETPEIYMPDYMKTGLQYGEIDGTSAITVKYLTGKEKTASVSKLMQDGKTATEALKEAVSQNPDFILFDIGEFVITEDITVPENITVAASAYALVKTDNATLTILSKDNGYLPTAGIFEGSVKLPNFGYVLTEWFVGNDCFTSAIDSGCKTVRLLNKSYSISQTVRIPSGIGAIEIVGEGHSTTQITSNLDGILFEMNSAKDGDSIKMQGISATGGNVGTFLSVRGENKNSDVKVTLSDDYITNYNTMAKLENCNGVVYEDLNCGGIVDACLFTNVSDVICRRSLIAAVSGYFVKVDGEENTDYCLVNFCSVSCRQNMKLENVKRFCDYAGGFDSAYGNEDITIDVVNCKDVFLKTFFISSSHKSVLNIENSESVTAESLQFHTSKNAVTVKNSKNVTIADNWLYQNKAEIVKVIDSENVRVKGNHYCSCDADAAILINNNSTVDFFGNICQGNNMIPGNTSFLCNENNGDTPVKQEHAAKIVLDDFEELIFADFGSTKSGVTYDTVDGYALEAPSGSWFGNIGITSKEKIPLNNLKVKMIITRDNYTDPMQDRNAGISFSLDKPSAMTTRSIYGNGLTNAEKSITFAFWFGAKEFKMSVKNDTGIKEIKSKVYGVSLFDSMPKAETLNLEFAMNDGALKVTVNGAEIVTIEGLGEYSESFVSYFAQAYGAAGITLEVLTQNGEQLK